MYLLTVQLEVPLPRFEPVASEVEGENSNLYTTEPPCWYYKNCSSKKVMEQNT